MIEIHNNDCLERLKTMPDNSVDSIVTDPPYGLSFMGKKWDYDVPSEEIWRECLRVLKPGGHLLAFAGTRTQHRMAVRIEDAGFEIRDMCAWIYGSGFPKSLDVSKSIDKEAGVEREIVGTVKRWGANASGGRGNQKANNYQPTEIGAEKYDPITAPATDDAKKWNGWGTALKPALEPITVARKPLSEKTVAANVIKWGTGAINIDGGRVGTETRVNSSSGTPGGGRMRACNRIDRGDGKTPDGRNLANVMAYAAKSKDRAPVEVIGRFPANLIHDGSAEVVGLFPETASGSASRFFYCAKASKKDRDAGLLCAEVARSDRGKDGNRDKNSIVPRQTLRRNNHPTVKPTDLMRYLVRLVTPPGGVVLDPFMGSGSTGKAARLEGFDFIGIERESEYCEIARSRIGAA